MGALPARRFGTRWCSPGAVAAMLNRESKGWTAWEGHWSSFNPVIASLLLCVVVAACEKRRTACVAPDHWICCWVIQDWACWHLVFCRSIPLHALSCAPLTGYSLCKGSVGVGVQWSHPPVTLETNPGWKVGSSLAAWSISASSAVRPRALGSHTWRSLG